MPPAETTVDESFPRLRKCPYRPPEEYDDLRAADGPAAARLYHGGRVWVITEYEQARAVLHDSRFSSDITHAGYPIYAEVLEGFRAFPLLNTLDPPLHTAQRRAIVSEFTLRRAEDLRPAMQKHADELLDAMTAGGNTADLVADFAEPFAGTITCWALGMDYADLQAWLVSSREVREKASGSATDTGDVGQEIAHQIVALQQYFQKFVDDKLAQPGDDPVSRVVEKYVKTGKLSKDELVKLCFVIFVAGQSPVKAMITIGLLRLLEQPAELAAVRDAPRLLPAAVEELTRLVSPLDLMPRVALEDVEIGGRLIRAGEGVVVAGAAANRDPAEYPDPDRLDLTREGRSHLAFGSGVHHCLGANLTKVGLQVAYATLLTRLPGLRLTESSQDIYPHPSWHPEIGRMPAAW
ncbi:cytochrome P450 [Streptomyces sp. NBC_00878]|uniref:cytochrome P450 n=1 Tax=Streptomyces sp. NBC_00878 TaxID=2975854 RepID=UPI00225618C7|nr:cytochrome P450 [Streptomyces sp. NBC_00878]MCX4902875.1 cytochrome P450 [Streptomyces sp. NBC_00878]